jgi:hypothetical protein
LLLLWLFVLLSKPSIQIGDTTEIEAVEGIQAERLLEVDDKTGKYPS